MIRITLLTCLALVLLFSNVSLAQTNDNQNISRVRVFIFAGQSNMVGSDSKVADIANFPPFVGLEEPQPNVRFSYTIGRENKMKSNGWVNLQPVDNVVGPELSFARKVIQNSDGPIAIIKCAAGGTHLGGDWNPDKPAGFEMYPLMIDLVRDSLKVLDQQNVAYQLEGFMWHQGENDMFEADYMRDYGKNLANFIGRVRKDLNAPDLNFYVGELCTKTIWGMDLRPRMYAISLGQKAVAAADPNVHYVPTSQVGVEIGGGVGLHYHYGTLGQLQHGEAYADAYLRKVGRLQISPRPLESWPYAQGEKVKLFIFAGQRNMEGERAFVQQVAKLTDAHLLKDDSTIAFKYNLGGGFKVSEGWEPLGPTGYYDTFGPELSFAPTIKESVGSVAIAKFTHSGSQMIDWTPEGSEAKSRNLYPAFIQFVKETIEDLKRHGQEVEVASVFYHMGENDMSFGPFRQNAAANVKALIEGSRKDLSMPKLKWYISQQRPTVEEGLDKIDVVAELEAFAVADPNLVYIKMFDLPTQPNQLVIETAGIIELGKLLANAYLNNH